MENFSKFNGKPAVPRSEKKAFKPLVIKKENMDEATKDQREYLGLELFGILRQFQNQLEEIDPAEGSEEEDKNNQLAKIKSDSKLQENSEEQLALEDAENKPEGAASL